MQKTTPAGDFQTPGSKDLDPYAQMIIVVKIERFVRVFTSDLNVLVGLKSSGRLVASILSCHCITPKLLHGADL